MSVDRSKFESQPPGVPSAQTAGLRHGPREGGDGAPHEENASGKPRQLQARECENMRDSDGTLQKHKDRTATPGAGEDARPQGPPPVAAGTQPPAEAHAVSCATRSLTSQDPLPRSGARAPSHRPAHGRARQLFSGCQALDATETALGG